MPDFFSIVFPAFDKCNHNFAFILFHNKYVNFFSLQFNPNIKEIHNNLLAKLINGYVGHNENSDTYVSWKLQFRNYCDLPTQQNGSVLDNVYYLEKVGLLSVGKYDVLKKIFSEDKEALSEIERVSNVIEIIDPSTIGPTGIHNDYVYL